MHEELVSLMSARKGHFRLESGHHGDLWLELDPLYLRPGRLRRFVAALARRLAAHDVEAICGPMVGGAFLAQMVALELDIEFYFAEQFARSDGDHLFPIEYRIPGALRPAARGRRIAIVDDVINAGSAIRGAFAALLSCDARPVAIGALLVLGDSASGLARAAGVPLEALSGLPNVLWEPSGCPLCTSGLPLEGVPEPARSADLRGEPIGSLGSSSAAPQPLGSPGHDRKGAGLE